MKSTGQVQYCQFKGEKPVSKHLYPKPDGTLGKEVQAHNLAHSKAQNVTVNPQQFQANLASAEPTQAFTYGVFGDNLSHAITTLKSFEQNPQSTQMTRSRHHLAYPENGAIFVIDVDNPEIYVNELIELLSKICSPLASTPTIYVPSSSSCIWDTSQGKWVREETGYRVYFFVEKGRLIPQFAQLLHKHLTLSGLVHFKVSSSGALLERGPLDMAMFSPHQPDFVGGAVCTLPLEPRRPPPQIENADAPLLDLPTQIRSLQLTPKQESRRQDILKTERLKVQQEAQERREEWLESRAQTISQRDGCSEEKAKKICDQALYHSVLEAGFLLKLSDGREVSVREINAAPHEYNGLTCCDPLEPEYHNDSRIAKIILLNGRPRVTTFAHGFHTYYLHEQHHSIIHPIRLHTDPGSRSDSGFVGVERRITLERREEMWLA